MTLSNSSRAERTNDSVYAAGYHEGKLADLTICVEMVRSADTVTLGVFDSFLDGPWLILRGRSEHFACTPIPHTESVITARFCDSRSRIFIRAAFRVEVVN